MISRKEKYMSSDDRSSQPMDEMLTAAETAKVLKVSESWLAKARVRGEGPPFIRLGRSVRYVRLREWLATQ
jgi:predicted DNA-binding transcriptional regulator AlpA